MPTWLLHVIGNIGVLMILGAYFLVSSSMIKSISPWYQSLNLVGAIIMAIYSAGPGGLGLGGPQRHLGHHRGRRPPG
jgi:peptidoglycan/LPS O-acetylase OafA/YrhL